MNYSQEIETEVEKAFKKKTGSSDFETAFIEEITLILKDVTSTIFYERQDFSKDISYLLETADDYSFSDRQLVLLVASYIERAMNRDEGSVQDRESMNTYMRLIKD